MMQDCRQRAPRQHLRMPWGSVARAPGGTCRDFLVQVQCWAVASSLHPAQGPMCVFGEGRRAHLLCEESDRGDLRT